MAKQTLTTIKNWFRTRLKPTQVQYWDTWDSFWHKDETIPVAKVENLGQLLNSKASNESVTNAIAELEALIEDLPDSYVDGATLDANALLILSRNNTLENLSVQFGTIAIKNFWTGTQAAYDAINPKDASTIYHVQEA